MNFKILNKKETKKIISVIDTQWDIGEDASKEIISKYTFLLNNEDKVYLTTINWELLLGKESSIRINNFGSYFGKFDAKDDIKLSIEGCKIIRPYARKNVLSITKEAAIEWFKGENIPLNKNILELNDGKKPSMQFVILKYEDHDLGCAKVLDYIILNQLSKSRRISSPFA